MTINKTAIVYIAYGPDHLHKQVILSILTLYYFLNKKGEFEKINLIVYTDNKEIFEKYLNEINIKYEILTSQKIKEYINNMGYIHRVKICVIKDCFQKYKSNILYVDGDTYFLKSPFELINKISDDISIFHVKEFELIEQSRYTEGKAINFGYFPEIFLNSVITKNNTSLKVKEIKIDKNTEMWNSGVIGISISNLSLLDKVLQINDQISKKTSYFLAEQFAFSYIFFKKTTLIPADQFIYHYWLAQLKEVYNFYIDKFLEENNGLTINSKAEKAVELTKHQNELSLSKKTKKEEFIRKLQKIRKLNKTKISFLTYHLSLQLTNFCRYWFRAIIISTRQQSKN